VINRYDNVGDYCFDMAIVSDGDYVLFTDHEDRNKRLREAVERSIKSHENLIELELIPARYVGSVKKEIRIMRKALEVKDEL